MKFLIKISSILLIILFLILIDYNKYNHLKKDRYLQELSSKILVNTSFMFKTNEYREFVYVK